MIGGHCAMPNIELLSRSFDSPFLDAIRDSNAENIARESAAATASS